MSRLHPLSAGFSAGNHISEGTAAPTAAAVTVARHSGGRSVAWPEEGEGGVESCIASIEPHPRPLGAPAR
ncbi:hypothetical protein GCM10027590_13680 [Nocardiopsis nanhaiensis]